MLHWLPWMAMAWAGQHSGCPVGAGRLYTGRTSRQNHWSQVTWRASSPSFLPLDSLLNFTFLSHASPPPPPPLSPALLMVECNTQRQEGGNVQLKVDCNTQRQEGGNVQLKLDCNTQRQEGSNVQLKVDCNTQRQEGGSVRLKVDCNAQRQEGDNVQLKVDCSFQTSSSFLLVDSQ